MHTYQLALATALHARARKHANQGATLTYTHTTVPQCSTVAVARPTAANTVLAGPEQFTSCSRSKAFAMPKSVKVNPSSHFTIARMRPRTLFRAFRKGAVNPGGWGLQPPGCSCDEAWHEAHPLTIKVHPRKASYHCHSAGNACASRNVQPPTTMLLLLPLLRLGLAGTRRDDT